MARWIQTTGIPPIVGTGSLSRVEFVRTSIKLKVQVTMDGKNFKPQLFDSVLNIRDWEDII